MAFFGSKELDVLEWEEGVGDNWVILYGEEKVIGGGSLREHRYIQYLHREDSYPAHPGTDAQAETRLDEVSPQNVASTTANALSAAPARL